MYMQRFSYLPAILMFQKNSPGTLGSKFGSAELTVDTSGSKHCPRSQPVRTAAPSSSGMLTVLHTSHAFLCLPGWSPSWLMDS